MSLPNQRDTLRDDVKRALVDPVRVCELLGIADGAKRQASGLLVRCPAHAERDPSCSVREHDDGMLAVKCHACGFSGDVFNLVAAVRGLDVGRDFPDVLQEAADLAGIDVPERRPRAVAAPVVPLRPAEPAKPAIDVEAAWEAMQPAEQDPDCWEYLHGRGLEPAAYLCRAVPESGGPDALRGMRVAAAMRDARGKVVAIQARDFVAGKAHGFRVLGSSNAGVFGDPSKIAEADKVVVAEGLSDFLAASMAANRSPKICVLGVAGVENTKGLEALPLKGKPVLLAFDADEKGDDCAERVAVALAKKGAKCLRARPDGGKDLCALLEAGKPLRPVFLDAIPLGHDGKPADSFRSASARVRTERKGREANVGRTLPFRVGFLDDVLGAIFPTDLILIGADTGAGKTTLAAIIAEQAALSGKRVHYFALEAHDDEIECRLKYSHIAKQVFGQDSTLSEEQKRRVNYQDFYGGLLDDILAPFEERATEELSKQYATLFTLYRKTEFGLDRLARELESIADETDLVVLDHLHYVDTDDDSENRAQKRITQVLKAFVDRRRKPVICVVHLKKRSDLRRKEIVPDLGQIHGSSDIIKIATRVILLARAAGYPTGDPATASTFIRAAKNRLDGSRCAFVGLCTFSARTNGYRSQYFLGRPSVNGEKFEFVKPNKLPPWAGRAITVLPASATEKEDS